MTTLYEELSINEYGVFTEDFLNDIDILIKQYNLDWKDLTAKDLLYHLEGVEAHNSGVYIRATNKHLPSEIGLSEDECWEIDPYLIDTATGLILPSIQSYEYELFIEELKRMI